MDRISTQSIKKEIEYHKKKKRKRNRNLSNNSKQMDPTDIYKALCSITEYPAHET
jgi:hypothetical protein